MDAEDRNADRRREVTDADDTGLIAGQEFVTEVETRPVVPHEDLHAALPKGHAAHATIDRLHTEMQRSSPDRGAIEGHVSNLRALPELEAAIANWWDDPKVQRFIGNLGQIGL
jgi:hypothetical protein